MARQHAPPETLTVLLVEDEVVIAMDLVMLLEEAGYEVIGPAGTVKAALSELDGHCPHACILDVNLQGEHSAPVASVLKANEVPFLLSSAYEQAELEKNPAFAGVTNIEKPASPQRLLSALATLLNV